MDNAALTEHAALERQLPKKGTGTGKRHMKFKSTITAFALAGLAALFTAPAMAVPLVPTLIVGAGGSISSLEDFTEGGTNFDFEDEELGYKLFAGVETNLGLPGLDPTLGLEAQYADLGQFELNAGGGEIHGTTLGLALRAGLNIGPVLQLHGKGGVHFWNADGSGPVGAFGDRDGEDFFFGLGGEFKILPNVGVRAEWERFSLDDADLDVGTISIVFRLF